MTDDKRASGFVPLKTVARGAPDAQSALAEIRQIYFRTSRMTIDNDFAHAIELLKSLPDDESRFKAHVYMEGLAEMRNEWGGKKLKVPGAGETGHMGKGERAKREQQKAERPKAPGAEQTRRKRPGRGGGG